MLQAEKETLAQMAQQTLLLREELAVLEEQEAQEVLEVLEA